MGAKKQEPNRVIERWLREPSFRLPDSLAICLSLRLCGCGSAPGSGQIAIREPAGTDHAIQGMIRARPRCLEPLIVRVKLSVTQHLTRCRERLPSPRATLNDDGRQPKESE